MTPSAPETAVRREIALTDLGEVARCLKRNFPRRTLGFWKRFLERLGEAPENGVAPRFGYLIAAREQVVAVLLTIGHQSSLPGAPPPRCNFSSWCADPPFRHMATTLPSPALARRAVVFTNLTPAPHTLPVIKAQGFRPYARGVFVTTPLVAPNIGARVTRFDTQAREAAELTPWEQAMLGDHQGHGLSALIGIDGDGVAPFVLKPLPLWRHPLPAMLVIYSRGEAELARFQRALGGFALGRGRMKLVIGANGPIPGLTGRYVEGRYPRYYRGPLPPAATDLAYSELALL